MATDILFLGKFYPQKLMGEIKEDSKGKVGFSNHNFEMSIIRGLEGLRINVEILTIPAVYSWPHNNKRVFTRAESYKSNGIPVKSVGFCNVIGLNRLTIFFNSLYNLLSVYGKYINPNIHIIACAPNTFVLFAMMLSKKLTRKHIDITVIIPDIPSMVTIMHRKNKSLKGWFVDRIDRWAIDMLEKCDKHVLLTEAMRDFFKRPIKYIVMEGLIDVDAYLKPHNDSYDKGIILYTGSIHRQFGIMNLVQAFEMSKLPGDVELWICGSGDSATEINSRTRCNNKIKFWGLVDSECAREMQQQATVLVNPRTSDFDFTKYSFPSKTLEYLMTGKPVIMNKLPGVPKEYYDYVITPKDESIASLSVTLEKVFSMTTKERENIGKSGREFVIKYKNAETQMKRVVDFISEL